jgi:hypothetical protein
MSLAGPDRPGETPLAVLEQSAAGRRVRCELFVDRVVSQSSDLLGSRRFALPLETLSPHVVIRQRGPLLMLLAGAVGAAVVAFAPGSRWPLALLTLLLGVLAWIAGRRQYIVFPGQLCDLELYRDVPDAASARRFVAQVVRRIEALAAELRVLERQKQGEAALDRVDELLAFRDLYNEGIIDRADLRMATEALARKDQGRIGFR